MSKFKYPLMKNNFKKEDFKSVINLLKTEDPKLTQGSNVKKFEERWSNWLGVKYSVFVNSGSSANLLTIAALKTKFPNGGEIIVPPLTWVSDISSILFFGFKPVFVDIDFSTLSLNNEEVISKINKNTVAVFITHAQGFNGLTKNLINYLKKKNVLLLEDVCESHGAEYKGKKCGTFGWVSNFSFYYAHHMSTIEGGMICTDNEEIYQLLRMLRGHGLLRESDNELFISENIEKNPELNKDFIFLINGFNVRNNEISALIGLSQLKKLDQNIFNRQRNFELFLSLINPKYFFVDFQKEGSSNYAFNLVLKDKNEELMNSILQNLTKQGIEFRRGSAGGGNQLRQPYLKNIVKKKYFKNFPVTEHIHFYGLYLGNFPNLNEKDIKFICSAINKVV